MAAEYYEFIGVSETATDDEVRRACARTLRRLAVANDEEGRAKLINQVRPTLTDPKSRAEYDALQAHGEEITAFTDEAFGAMDAEDWPTAIRLWKQVLVRMESSEVAMAHLGLALSLSGDYPRAVRVLESCCDRHPQSFGPWMCLGRARLSLAYLAGDASNGGCVTACPECGQKNRVPLAPRLVIVQCGRCQHEYESYAEDRSPLMAQAQSAFARAEQIQPYNPDPYLWEARVLLAQEDCEGALHCAERAVAADGQSNFQDFEAFFLICEIHARAGQPDELLRTAERINALVPPDDSDARGYATYRFASHAHELAKRWGFETAALYLRGALTFAPSDSNLESYRQYCETGARVVREFPRLKDDQSIIAPLRDMAIAMQLRSYGTEDMAPDESTLDRMLEALGTCPTASVLQSLSALQRSYPATYQTGEGVFSAIRNAAREAEEQSQGARGFPSGQTSEAQWACRECGHRMGQQEWQGRVTTQRPGWLGMRTWYRCPRCGTSTELTTW